MQINVEIKNIDKIRKTLNKSPQIVSKFIDTAIKRSIYTIQRASQQLTPVDTGLLRQNQFAVFEPLKGIYTPIMNYATFVEYGTSKMRAQPYLRPGVEKSIKNINKEFEIGLENALEAIAKETR